jgi:hypothetical protein
MLVLSHLTASKMVDPTRFGLEEHIFERGLVYAKTGTSHLSPVTLHIAIGQARPGLPTVLVVYTNVSTFSSDSWFIIF